MQKSIGRCEKGHFVLSPVSMISKGVRNGHFATSSEAMTPRATLWLSLSSLVAHSVTQGCGSADPHMQHKPCFKSSRARVFVAPQHRQRRSMPAAGCATWTKTSFAYPTPMARPIRWTSRHLQRLRRDWRRAVSIHSLSGSSTITWMHLAFLIGYDHECSCEGPVR